MTTKGGNFLSISAIYKIFAEEVASIDFICRPGCSTCCTRSVTLTTGEGRLILEYLREHGGELPPLPHDSRPLRPALTTNGLAALYLAGQEPEEGSESPWLFEPCFFLRHGLCTIYEARPFACRSFGSTVNCATTGTAQSPPWFVTLAIVANQVLEESDRSGHWGNLSDILAFLAGRENGDYHASGRLLANQLTPGYLVLPEERERVSLFLEKLGWSGLI
jgi:Fe-S-cluster containining protein